jgi:nucleotide-binding universal stress UspA family protein
MKILMATDGSRDAAVGLRTAVRLLAPADRTIDILCVAPRFAKRHGGNGLREEYERRILRQTTRILDRARSIVADGGNVNLLTEIGSPSAAIVSRAEDYDLTVIGAKGRAATSNGGLGPVANRVVEHALGAVLVAREPRNEESLRALVAVDGSSASLNAIEAFRSLFDLTGAELCLMHVAETPWIHLGLEDEWETYDEEDKERSEAGVFEKEMVREGESIIEQARDAFRSTRVSLTTRIDEGNPADQILSEADRGQYDLIVLGAAGTRDLKHSMLGSVSAKIARNASGSVLIVRERD